MTDSGSQRLSDKSLSEFEKELEEVVRAVDVSSTIPKDPFTENDKTDNITSQIDLGIDSQINESNVSCLLDSNCLNINDKTKSNEETTPEKYNDVTEENVSNTNVTVEHVEIGNVDPEPINSSEISNTIPPSKEATDDVSQIFAESVQEQTSEKDNLNEESICMENLIEGVDQAVEDSDKISENIPESEQKTVENHKLIVAHLQDDSVVEEESLDESTGEKDVAINSVTSTVEMKEVIIKSFLDANPDEEVQVDSLQEKEIVIINDSENSTVLSTSNEVNNITTITETENGQNEVVQINFVEEHSTCSIKEIPILDSNEEVQTSSPGGESKKRIPSHVLGRNVENPAVDTAGTGRIPPKPRLGVKIPYRNLTSQIVTKDEIAEEIMERSRLRNASLEPSEDILFARKLTQRLARKIAAAEKVDSPPVKKDTNEKHEKPSSSSEKEKKEKIADNSDLLAILEGDEDPEWPQLNANKRSSDESKTSQNESPRNGNKADLSSDKNDGDDFIAEPRFSSSLVTKTYTRKRKSSGDSAPVNATPKKVVVSGDNKPPAVENKVNIDLAPNTYISKSSRVIKKKVIWDPDEAVPMSKFAVSKPKIEPKTSTPTKTVEKKIVKTEKPTATPIKPTPEKKPVITKTQVTKDDKTPKKPIEVIKTAPEKPSQLKKSSPPSTITVKKSPTSSKQQASKNKRLTEIDKLLMDEGAVNMLYAVKNTEDNNDSPVHRTKGRKKADNFQQELLDKTNEIKNDLQMNSSKESPKSLRKKDNSIPILKRSEVVGPTGIPLARKKSKDSLKNSTTSSPPSSPPYSTYTAEASRIIRRHSSSSFSSVESHTENVNDENKSVNGGATPTSSSEKGPAKLGKRKSPSISSSDGSKVKKMKSKESGNVVKKQQKQKEKVVPPSENNYVQENEEKDDSDKVEDQMKLITLKKIDDIVQIVLPSSASERLNETILNEISTALDELKKDDNCTTVVLTSAGSSFTQGIDYSILIDENINRRKVLAEKLALSVKNFLKNLAAFPKLLVAGVQKEAIGLGVTMLPLFDMVLASDLATFSAPYASLGCTVEGGSLLSLPNMMHNALSSELFYASRKLSASDALRFGLVTRTLWPEKFEEELLSSLKAISKQSLQGMMSIKKTLRNSLLSNIDALLKEESSTLVSLWTSEECQNNFKKYLLVQKE